MRVIETLYELMPIPIQNVMISAKGYQLRHFRYGHEYRRYFKMLLETEWLSADDLLRVQRANLRALISHAYSNVPYYREKWMEVDVGSISEPAELVRLPVLEKDELRTRLPELMAEGMNSQQLYWAQTSGSTGTPLRVAFTKQDMQRRMATLDRMLYRAGYRRGQRSARFSGRLLYPRAERNHVFWRYNAALKQMFFSTYHMTPDNLVHYIEQLRKFSPVLIDGYPSALFTLARYMLENRLVGKVQPKAIAVTAETLGDDQRQTIEAAFGCKVYNQYASSEGAPFITECPHGRLHVNPESGVFEFVRPGTEEPAEPGELAEMLVTSFTTTAFPLIRYRIGDYAIPSAEQCSCGRNMQVVEAVLGRQEEIIFTPERGYVGRVSPVLTQMPVGIKRSQILQVEPDRFVVRVSADEETFRNTNFSSIINQMRARLGNVNVDIEQVEDIPLGPNGKFRAVVGLNSPEAEAYRTEKARQ